MNSNVIQTSRNWNTNSYEKDQFLDKVELGQQSVHNYQRKILLNKAPDTIVEDDSKRDKVKSNYAILNLHLEGQRASIEPFLNETFLGNRQQDARGFSDEVPMGQVKLMTYQKANWIESNMYNDAANTQLAEQKNYYKGLEEQQQIRDELKYRLKVFSDEKYNYNPNSRPLDEPDSTAALFNAKALQMQTDSKGNTQSLSQQKPGDFTALFSRTEPDHQVQVADYSTIFYQYHADPMIKDNKLQHDYTAQVQDSKYSLGDIHNLLMKAFQSKEQMLSKQETFDAQKQTDSKSILTDLHNMLIKPFIQKKPISGKPGDRVETENKQLAHIFEQLTMNAKAKHQINDTIQNEFEQKQYDQKIQPSELNNVVGIQSNPAHGLSLIERYSSYNPYNLQQKQIFEKSRQLGLDAKTLNIIKQQTEMPTISPINMQILEQFVTLALLDKQRIQSSRLANTMSRISYEQEYEQIVNSIVDSILSNRTGQNQLADIQQINNRTQYTHSKTDQNTTQQRANIRQHVLDILMTSGLTAQQLQKATEQQITIKYTTQMQEDDSYAKHQQMVSHFLNNQDVHRLNQQQTAKTRLQLQDIDRQTNGQIKSNYAQIQSTNYADNHLNMANSNRSKTYQRGSTKFAQTNESRNEDISVGTRGLSIF